MQCTLILCEPGYECILGECVCINDMDNDGMCDEDEIRINELHHNKQIILEYDLLGKQNSKDLQKNITIYLYEDGTIQKVKNID